MFKKPANPHRSLTVPAFPEAGACALARSGNRKLRSAASVPGRCIQSGSSNCKAGSWTAGPVPGSFRPECPVLH